MAKVKIGDQVREYQEGTPYLEIAKEYQGQYSYDILLVSVNGKLAELQKKVSGDCSLSPQPHKKPSAYSASWFSGRSGSLAFRPLL